MGPGGNTCRAPGSEGSAKATRNPSGSQASGKTKYRRASAGDTCTATAASTINSPGGNRGTSVLRATKSASCSPVIQFRWTSTSARENASRSPSAAASANSTAFKRPSSRSHCCNDMNANLIQMAKAVPLLNRRPHRGDQPAGVRSPGSAMRRKRRKTRKKYQSATKTITSFLRSVGDRVISLLP